MVPGRPVQSTRLLSASLAAAAIAVFCATQSAPAAEPERYALLVGVGNYPRLAPRFQLKGPPNDMRVMKAALEGAPFRMKAGQITVLTDWQTEKNLQPTRANIEREFVRLAEAAHKGDQVFILLGGHGSQQPNDQDPTDFEPDGLDETFLPSDVSGWDGKKGRVTSAIADDEIRAWVDRIRNTGAFVWIAFDSCHSGTMIRGASAAVERERQVPMAELVPPEARVQFGSRSASGQQNYAADQEKPSALSGNAGEVFALYAAQSYETTPDTGVPTYGLLTSTMVEVLTQARSSLTYRELTERITERYRVAGRIAPTPMFEGTGVDREVLGQTTWPDRPQWTIALDARRGIIINAGRLHGLARGRCSRSSRRAGTPTRTHVWDLSRWSGSNRSNRS